MSHAADPLSPRPDHGAAASPGARSTGRIVAWALWDWGSASFNAVVTTFVFSVYLTSEAFGPDASTHLGFALGLAGLTIALVAPVSGRRADAGGTRVRSLGLWTTVVVVVTALLYFVRPDAAYLPVGLVLLAVGNIAFEMASVNYHALLPQIAPPGGTGRVSAFGWGLGYVGGIVLLLIVYLGFIAPEVGLFGVTGEDGADVRTAMLVCAVWALGFSLPVLLREKDDLSRRTARARASILTSYRELGASVVRLWREERGTLGFLLASAIYRDGLAGVFTFGGVLAALSFGFSGGEVIVFGIVANLVAGAVTILSGAVDDRVGPRRVILGSLTAMLVLGTALFVFAEGGKPVFWVLGLALSSFVGPVQSASRTYLTRLIPAGREGEMFGLYATTGRAVSFLAPWAFSTAILAGGVVFGAGADQARIYGILGIVAVLGIGLVAMLLVPAPGGSRTIRG